MKMRLLSGGSGVHGPFVSFGPNCFPYVVAKYTGNHLQGPFDRVQNVYPEVVLKVLDGDTEYQKLKLTNIPGYEPDCCNVACNTLGCDFPHIRNVDGQNFDSYVKRISSLRDNLLSLEYKYCPILALAGFYDNRYAPQLLQRIQEHCGMGIVFVRSCDLGYSDLVAKFTKLVFIELAAEDSCNISPFEWFNPAFDVLNARNIISVFNLEET